MSFLSVGQVVEFRDGGVMVLDVRHGTLVLIDFLRNTNIPAGPQSSTGPAYSFPGTLLVGAGDSIGYFENGSRRLLWFTPDGRLYRSVQIADSGLSSVVNPLTPMAMDRLGRIYGQTLGVKVPAALADTSQLDFADLGGLAQEQVQLLDSVDIQRSSVDALGYTAVARIRNFLAQSSSIAAVRSTRGIKRTSSKFSLSRLLGSLARWQSCDHS